MGERTDDIRRDIERTQREMSRTIDEIQYRLSPHNMMERTKTSMREAGVNASRSFVDRIRDNPIPAAMAGVGLFLLMRDSGGGDGYDVEFIPENYGFEEEEDGKLAEAKERAAARARELKMQARSRMMRARHQSRDVFQDNPLIAGLAAVAAGAILGALIPETQREHELMGETRDRLADRARSKAREGMDRAKDVAGAATQAAKEAAKEEGKSQSRPGRTDVGQNIGVT